MIVLGFEDKLSVLEYYLLLKDIEKIRKVQRFEYFYGIFEKVVDFFIFQLGEEV